MTPADRFAQSPEPVSDDDIRRLSAEGCNAAELSAYTGHEPLHACEIVFGEWWRPIGWDA